jgi:hypothetical protein
LSIRFSICSSASWHGDFGVAADHGIKGFGPDDQQPGALLHHRTGRPGLVVDNCHLPEKGSRTQGDQQLLLVAGFLGDIDLPGLDDVHLVAHVAFLEDHRAGWKLSSEALKKLVAVRHGRMLLDYRFFLVPRVLAFCPDLFGRRSRRPVI